MSRVRSFSASRLLPRLLGTAALALATPALANNVDIISPDTLKVTGSISIAATNGEESWLNRGFGTLTPAAQARVTGECGRISMKPISFGSRGSAGRSERPWLARSRAGNTTKPEISEAYLTYRPMRGARTCVSGRAGLMWPPVSLEHEGADWHVRDTITPSAINSWIGEEVRPAAVEGTIDTEIGEQKLSATAAIFAANDTAGTLLTFRGWAMHDRRTLAFNHQPLPPFDAEDEGYQAHYTHPLLDVAPGFANCRAIMRSSRGHR